MNCIFCKIDSDNSVSIEHIIPESLGNEEYVLPLGWVCDKCNNYFASKVEAPFLNSYYCKQARFEMRVPNKRKRVPVGKGLYPLARAKIDLFYEDSGLSFFASDEKDIPAFVEALTNNKGGTLYIPQAGLPKQNYSLSRFIGKVGLEVLAYKMFDDPMANNEIVNKTELDELRNYVRRGKPGFVWPIHVRRIYPAAQLHNSLIYDEHQVLNEFDIMPIDHHTKVGLSEYYAVIIILGVEYVINLGGPELHGYQKWLELHDGVSYLYYGKNNIN